MKLAVLIELQSISHAVAHPPTACTCKFEADDGVSPCVKQIEYERYIGRSESLISYAKRVIRQKHELWTLVPAVRCVYVL